MRIASKATKGKGKRWLKGSASSCNPTNKRHRMQVKSNSIQLRPQSHQSLHLNEEVLSQFNSIQFQKLRLDNNTPNASIDSNRTLADNPFDTQSIGNQSFASVWTNCSNVSFNKLLLEFDSSSATHKQMLSVLAAITETIHANGGKETETEYFAALMTYLESVENEETLTAILSLLQMVIKRLPPNVIRLKFSETSKVFIEYLAKFITGENGLIVRSLTNSIAVFLQNQEPVVWELSSTKHIFEVMLTLSVHNKPRFRKCAQKAIARILKTDTNQSKSSSCHPIAKLTADFCIRKLINNEINDNINTTLYVLSLLTDILSVLPNPSLKKCCESILTIMTFGNVLIVSNSFKAFSTLFAAKPHEELLTPELNAKLISALYDYQPNINDSQPLCAWFQTITNAFLNLHRIEKRLCFNHLPKLFNISISCLLSDSKEVYMNFTKNLKQLFTECIETSALEIDKSIIEKIYSSLEKSLQYEYCNAWIHIFGLITHMFDSNFAEFTQNIIIKLIVIRESYDCIYASDIDRTIGRAVQVFGPKYVVNCCSLNLSEENEVSNSWLLPVLRDNIKNTELSFFIEYFVPLAAELQQLCKRSEGNTVLTKTYSIAISQIWSLLPSFFTLPTDFVHSFKKIAKNLGEIISDNSSLRVFVLTAFRNITKGCDESVRKELSKYSKNFIPIFFNIYTNENNSEEEKNQRFLIYETIQMFVSVSENSLILSLYSKVIEKLQNSENQSFMRHSLWDLVRVFVPYIGNDDIKYIYNEFVVPFTKDNKLITEQKKAFRILEEICSNESNVCHNFVDNNLVEITKHLTETISKCLSSSKSYALKAIKDIVEKHFSNNSMNWKNLLIEVIPKSLDCLLVNSQKVKRASFDLIICSINVCKSLNNENPYELIELIISYLREPQYSSTAVILCLTRLYSVFRNEIPKHIECDLIENILSNLSSNNRQTIQSSIDFLKCFFKTASAEQLSTYLELLIIKLSNIDRLHKNHFRVKIKEIFVRLIRKFGYEMISKMIPEEYKKVLKNIRKVEDRKKRKSEKDSDESEHKTQIKTTHEIQDIIADSSDEESNDDNQMTNDFGKSNAWIKDDINGDEDVFDLLSIKKSQNILSKNPDLKTNKSKEKFELSNDGKIIVYDLDKHKRGIKRSHDETEDTEPNVGVNDDMVSNKESIRSSNTKHSVYKTGGKGIHRPIDKQIGEEYKSNKARGDMKRKGRPDPFAYIPLNHQFLNKRKRAKLTGRFNNVVKAATKGAKKGANNRNTKKRKK